jgi:hypothetical protein
MVDPEVVTSVVVLAVGALSITSAGSAVEWGRIRLRDDFDTCWLRRRPHASTGGPADVDPPAQRQ